MSVLCWNCRGLGSPATVREVRELANKFTIAVLGLVKTQIDKARAENLALSFGYSKSFAVGSSGRSGGLVIFWNEEIKLEVVNSSQYHIDTVISDGGRTMEINVCIWRSSCTREIQNLGQIEIHSSLTHGPVGSFG